MYSIIVSSAGGPAAENAIRSLKLAEQDMQIIGTDNNLTMLRLSSSDFHFPVHHASEATEFYVRELNVLSQQYNSSMFIPISDREIYVAALHEKELPPMSIPNYKVVDICRDKAKLYKFMNEQNLPVPETIYPITKKTEITKPMWMRATIGAGGFLATKVETTKDVQEWLHLQRSQKRQFMLTQYLAGPDYCWTSLWVKGLLRLSVTKQRKGWVYNRIGTTAIQETIMNSVVDLLCTNTIASLIRQFQPKMTSLMMVDLKTDLATGKIYITEINAGRTGTVSLWFALASQLVYGDQRVNFHYQLVRAHHGEFVQMATLPKGIEYIRHIDMGSLLTWKDKSIRCKLQCG